MFMPQQYPYTKIKKCVEHQFRSRCDSVWRSPPSPSLCFLESLKLFNIGDKNLPQIKVSSAIYSS